MTNWTELKRLAEEVGGIEWHADTAVANDGAESRAIYHRPTPNHVVEIIETPDSALDNADCIHSESVWKFIAAANPKTILALIAENERLRIQQERNEAVIDLDALAWESIKEAANNSPWMPEQYMLNDWLADVCEFLREPARQMVCDERYQFDSAYEQVVENGWDNVKNMAWQIWQARAALKEKQ